MMKRNFSTANSEKHWHFVEQTADRVSQWPAWKQVEYQAVVGEVKPSDTPEEKPSSDSADNIPESSLKQRRA